MKFLILTLCLASALADVSHILAKEDNSARSAQIVRQEFSGGADGNYQYGFETENGISAQEQGALKDVQAENPAEQVQGQYQYTAPGGELIQVQYTADENGFQPSGAHLPTSPPIPEAIARSLEYIRAHPTVPEN